MSGGQRQRLAIARSIVGEPSILILDEATSSIDIQGEKLVQAALDRVSKDRTTIMIAHRLSTVFRADRIIVIKDGTNVEEGSHDELMDRHTVYHSLVHAQQLETRSDVSSTAIEGPISVPTDDLKTEIFTPTESDDAEDQVNDIQYGKERGVTHTLWRIVYEQRSHWFLYVLIIVGAMGAGCKLYPCVQNDSWSRSAYANTDLYCI